MHGPEEPSAQPPELSTWKAIASYLGVRAKTAQRWEKSLGLPVRREAHGEKARVYADPSALDAWRLALEDEAAKRKGQRFGSSRRLTVAAILLLIAGAGATVLLQQPSVAVPETCEVDGTRLEVFAGERLLWSVEESPDPGTGRVLRPGNPRCLVVDLDRDEESEVLFNYAAAEALGENGRLIALSGPGVRRWQFDYGRELTLGDRRFHRFFGEALLRVIEQPQQTYILVASHHDLWFPAQIALLDPGTGELQAEYWHPGWIYDLALLDLDRDGVEELLLAGINNPGDGPGYPALAVLEVPFSRRSGTGGSLPNYFGAQNLKEEAYVLFPQPDAYVALGIGAGLSDLAIQDDERLLVVFGGAVGGEYLYIYLDYQFRVIDVRPSDAFRAKHDLLYREGILDHPYGPQDVADQSRLLYLETAPDGNESSLRRRFAEVPESPVSVERSDVASH